MVLLVLAMVWGVLLVSWLRSRTERTFADSVGTFRRHLTVLERAAPARVQPANRLRTGTPAPQGLIPPFRPVTSIRGQRLPGPGRPASANHLASVSPIAPRRSAASAIRRRQAQKRRRDVFFALLAGAGGSLVMALLPGMSAMWPVQVMFDLMLGAYVALLIRLRNLSAERDLQWRLSPGGPRRRPAYDLGAGAYADLGLRRVAN